MAKKKTETKSDSKEQTSTITRWVSTKPELRIHVKERNGKKTMYLFVKSENFRAEDSEIGISLAENYLKAIFDNHSGSGESDD